MALRYVWGLTLEDTRHGGAALDGSCGKEATGGKTLTQQCALRMTGTAEESTVVDMMQRR